MQIDGSVALITGGASGLGLAAMRLLVSQGASVVIADLESSTGAQTAKEFSPRVEFIATDVTNEEQVTKAVELAAGIGELRVVVNCAGVATPGRIIGRNGPLPIAEFRRVIEINLIGTFNVMRTAAEYMAGYDAIDGDRGIIIMTASVAAYEGQVGQIAYSASKAGVVGMTICAARDLAERAIRVVTIAPGIFETPMMRGLPEAAQQSLAAQTPHPNRLGRADEYAALVAHIISNPMLNGETIRLDGAIRMAPR